MYIIDPVLFQTQLKKRGFSTIGELAQSMGIHRNTIHHYLSGNSVFPDKFEKILTTLKLNPAQAIVEKKTTDTFIDYPIAPTIDQLHQKFPDITLILFGSRAQNRAHKYSDWDIAVYSAKGLNRVRFNQIKIYKNELEDHSPYFINLTLLNQADKDFILELAKSWQFLTGSRQDWITLNEKVWS